MCVWGGGGGGAAAAAACKDRTESNGGLPELSKNQNQGAKGEYKNEGPGAVMRQEAAG